MLDILDGSGISISVSAVMRRVLLFGYYPVSCRYRIWLGSHNEPKTHWDFGLVLQNIFWGCLQEVQVEMVYYIFSLGKGRDVKTKTVQNEKNRVLL